jgi:hypothetical protein
MHQIGAPLSGLDLHFVRRLRCTVSFETSATGTVAPHEFAARRQAEKKHGPWAIKAMPPPK